MPTQLTTYRIKDLPEITLESDLINKSLEVENPAGTGADQNFRVSVPKLVQTVANNLPGANNAKSSYKTVIAFDRAVPGLTPNDAVMSELNQDFLCLGCICYVEFPQPSREYRLVYSANGPLNVWKNGTYSGDKIPARWVERNSLAETLSGIRDFNPFEVVYAKGTTVKHTVEGSVRLFVAKSELVKSTMAGNVQPEPNGFAQNIYWQEIANTATSVITDFIPGTYEKNDVVLHNNQFHRAKSAIVIGDFVNQSGTYDSFPDPDYWEVIGGGTSYNDTLLRNRVAAVESGLVSLGDITTDNYQDLTNAINSKVSTAPDYTNGSYVKGQFVNSDGIVFIAKQSIANSTVSPTTTNAYWLQISGLTPDVNKAYVDAADMLLRNTLNTKAATTYVDTASSGLQTQINNVNSLKANIASPGFTGVPTAPTPANTSVSSQIATTAFVNTNFNKSLMGDAVQYRALFANGTINDTYTTFRDTSNAVNVAGQGGTILLNKPHVQANEGGFFQLNMTINAQYNRIDFGTYSCAIYAGTKFIRNSVFIGDIILRAGTDTTPAMLQGGSYLGKISGAVDAVNGKIILDNVKVYPRVTGAPAAVGTITLIMRNGSQFIGCVPDASVTVVYEAAPTGDGGDVNKAYVDAADAVLQTQVNAKANKLAVRSSTAVTFEADAEYTPVYSNTFTVDDTTKVTGSVVTIYLGTAAIAPTIPGTGYKLIGGAYEAGKNLMYMFKVGANGQIQYTITNTDS